MCVCGVSRLCLLNAFAALVNFIILNVVSNSKALYQVL